MSELSVKVAQAHRWTLVDKVDREGNPYVTGGCACGADLDGDGNDGIEHTEHVAAATETAVRQSIAAAITEQSHQQGRLDMKDINAYRTCHAIALGAT